MCVDCTLFFFWNRVLKPPGAMSLLKIQVVFFPVENLQAVIGCSGSRDVFVVASKFNSEMQAMFCVRIIPSLYSFSCGNDFC